MRPPPGLENDDDPTLVMHLKRSIYGAMQSGYNWKNERNKHIIDVLCFKRLDADPCIFYKAWDDGTYVIAGFYVNDCISIGDERCLLDLETALNDKWGISGQGELHWTLGIRFVRNPKHHTVSLSQETYIDSLLNRFNLQTANVVTTPFTPNSHLSNDMSPNVSNPLNVPYRELSAFCVVLCQTLELPIGWRQSTFCATLRASSMYP